MYLLFNIHASIEKVAPSVLKGRIETRPGLAPGRNTRKTPLGLYVGLSSVRLTPRPSRLTSQTRPTLCNCM